MFLDSASRGRFTSLMHWRDQKAPSVRPERRSAN